MKAETEKQIKAELNYIDRSPTCKQCRHFSEEENPMLDRDWIPSCNLMRDTLGVMSVKPEGCCVRFVAKAGGSE